MQKRPSAPRKQALAGQHPLRAPINKGARSHNVTESTKPGRLDCAYVFSRPTPCLRAEAARSKLTRHITRGARLNEATRGRGKDGASLLLQRRG